MFPHPTGDLCVLVPSFIKSFPPAIARFLITALIFSGFIDTLKLVDIEVVVVILSGTIVLQ